MLIDELEDRADNIQMINPKQPASVFVDDEGTVWMLLDGSKYVLQKQALDTLFNTIRLPIKYVERLISYNASVLAEQNINFGMKNKTFSFLMNAKDEITQVFDQKKMYVPMLTINDEIMDFFDMASVHDWSISDDLFSAIYLGTEVAEIDGHDYSLGIKVLYSHSFNVPPRFDGVLKNWQLDTTWIYAIQNRKFRVAQNSVAEIVEQVKEFAILAIDQTKQDLIPALRLKLDTKYEATWLFERMFSDLRLSKKLLQQILEWFTGEETIMLLNYHLAEACNNLDEPTARELQTALSRFVVTNKFK